MKTAFMTYYANLPAATDVVQIKYPATSGVTYNIAIAAGSYCAQTLADAISTGLSTATSGNVTMSFDPLLFRGRYQIGSSSGNFDLLAINAAYQPILGTVAATSTWLDIANTAGNMSLDKRTYLLKRGINWGNPSQFIQSQATVSGTGRVVGRVPAASANYRFWSLEFIANDKEIYKPTSENAYTQHEDVLNRFGAGSKMRVYLNWSDAGRDTSQWSNTNTDGYIDLLPMREEPIDYQWTSRVARYVRVSINGMEE